MSFPRGLPLVPPAVRRALDEAVGGLPATFWYLWVGSLVNKLGGFVLPFLALYLTEERKLSIAHAGAIVSLYGVGALIASPTGGVLADRIGRRATMVLGLSASSVAMAFLGFAREPAAIAIAAFALGLVNDLFRPAVSAVVADVVAPAHRLRAFGLLYWAVNLGFAIAPVLAGALIRHGFLVLFLADAATTLAYAVITWVKVPETRPRREEATPAQGTWLAPFTDRVFLPFFALSLLVATVFHQFIVTLPTDFARNGLSPSDYGMVIAINGALIVALQPFVTRRVAARRRSAVLALSALLVGLGFGATALASTIPTYAATVVVWTIGEILMSPVNASVVADLAPTHLRGRYQGAFVSSWGLAAFAGPALGSLVLGGLGRGYLWGACALAGAIAAAGHLAIGPARRRRILELHGDGHPAKD